MPDIPERHQETPGAIGIVRKVKEKQKRAHLVIPCRERKQLLH